MQCPAVFTAETGDMGNPENLDGLRARIDEIDRRLVSLLNERARVGQEIGAVKRGAENAAGGQAVYVPARERDVYEHVTRVNQGPLPEGAIRAIYREIMSGIIAIQRPTRVAYLGPAGTNTHLAVRAKFGSSVEGAPQATIKDVFLAVMRGHADYGLVPIENSIEGGVNQTQDGLIETRVKIYSEVLLPIHHHLMALERKPPKVIYSHPQILGQCRDWLSANAPEAQQVEMASSTVAAERAAREPGAAAIASSVAADLYNLQILEANIEDQPDNMTRFILLAARECPRTGDDKTTIFFTIKDRVGALAEILSLFQRHGVNLTWIQSRPSRRKAWDYVFWADILGHCQDPAVAAALAEAREVCQQMDVCGSYPVARFEEGAAK
jgi:chorismate mutase / prephenate dehydratase